MFHINLRIAKGSSARLGALTKEMITGESVPGYIEIVCGDHQYGYCPESEVMDVDGDCWVDYWLSNFIAAVELLNSHDYVGVADPENFRNVIQFVRQGDRVTISHVEAMVDFAIVLENPEDSQEIWSVEESFHQLSREIERVSGELADWMINTNKNFEHSARWSRLASGKGNAYQK